MCNVKALSLLLLIAACGPSPRPVPLLPAPSAPATRLPAEPRVIWQKDFGAGILSALEPRGGVLFATTTNRAVVAVDQSNGQRYWLQRFDGPVTTGVAIAEGRLYFATEDVRGEAHAIETARGRGVWKRRIGPTRLPPLLSGELVIFATEAGWLYALNRNTGEISWRTRLDGGAALELSEQGGAIITASANDTTYRIDPSTGAIQQKGALPATPTGPRLLSGNALIIPLHDGSVARIDAGSLGLVSRIRVSAPVLAAPQGDAGSFYLLTRTAEVWRVRNGPPERIATLNGAARKAFLKVGDELVAGLLDGRIVALSTEGRQRWEFQAERSVAAPFTAVSEALFVPLLNGSVLRLQ